MSCNKMAKLINVFHSTDIADIEVKRRQLPVACGETQMLMMDLGSRGLTFDQNVVNGRDLDSFADNKYKLLTRDELRRSLEVSRQQFAQLLSVTVPCVGCRCSVDRLFDRLMETGYPTVYPLVITVAGVLTISPDKIRSAATVCSLLSRSDQRLNDLVENQPRSKKSSRCSLHTLDSFRSRPFSEQWLDVWNCMNKRSKEEIAVVEADELQATLDGYLKKHKFCTDCRTKVEKAYSLLMNEANPSKESGYVASLYSGIKKCIAKKHIHLQTKADFIDNLIRKAEPELNGSHFRHRERHAKTLEIAQEEVLTCVGMCIYEKLRRIHVCLREEENACQVLGAVAVSALSRSFDMAVENKTGISKLELYYEELSREERLKEQRKEQKKLKKRRKRNERRNATTKEEEDSCEVCEDDESVADVCDCDHPLDDEEEEEEEDETASCHSCHEVKPGGTQTSIDGGYASEHGGSSAVSSLNNSPEGSEVACSDGLCNHGPHHALSSSRNTPDIICSKYYGSAAGFTSILEQMLVDSTSEDEEEPPGIPDELIVEFKTKHKNVNQERQELRERLVKSFNHFCTNKAAAKN